MCDSFGLPLEAEAVVGALQIVTGILLAMEARSLAAAAGDITPAQYRALGVLCRRGPQRPLDLADELDILPSSVSRLADRLVRKGLVIRQDAVDNRREVRLAVTVDGQRAVEMVSRIRCREIARLAAAIPAGGRDVVVASLQAFSHAAVKSAGMSHPSDGAW